MSKTWHYMKVEVS